MLVAITHHVSDKINECELSYLDKSPIDISLAREQHAQYCRMLRDWGIQVFTLNVNRDHPDSVFVEDTALVLDQIAVLCRMGARSRRQEVEGIRPFIESQRKTVAIEPPATLEGGDVLIVGKKVFAGLSQRTNPEGVEALRGILQPYGWEVIPVKVKACLHLKSACTALDENTLLLNRAWCDPKDFPGFEIIPAPQEEPHAANALRAGSRIALYSGHPRTIDLVRSHGYDVTEINISELIKAESGLTCSSIIFKKEDQ